MRSFKHSFFLKNKEIKIIAIYAIAFISLLILIKVFFKENLFEASNFLYWDAEHYFYNRDHPYDGYRAAFFPLLSLIWKWLSLDVYGIVLFNSLVYLVSLWILAVNLKMPTNVLLVCITIPGAIFFYLPYSESLFFFSSTLILLGLKKKKTLLVVFGLFIAALTRPAFIIFIPALIITVLFSVSGKWIEPSGIRKHFIRKELVRLGYFLFAILAGTLVVMIIQYRDTSEWFTFLTAQKDWGNHLQWPKFPLTSWAGGFIVRLDATAFMIGSMTGTFLLLWMLRTKLFRQISVPDEVIFSLAYLGGITLSVFAFRGGSLFSLNRFVYSTAFMYVAMHFFLNLKIRYSIKKLLYILIFIIAFWMIAFHSFSHIQYFLNFGALSLYLILPFTLLSDRQIIQKTGLILLIILNFTFQIIFYQRFLDGGWIA